MAGAAFAELQNVQLGGQLEVRGRWYHNAFETGVAPMRPGPVQRISPAVMGRRATGQAGVLSLFRYDDVGNDWAFYEMTTSLSAKADFTDNVSACIELYSFEFWGQDFRSNYVTGVDRAAATADDVEILQSYVQVDEMFGQPLSLRVGRQILQFGRDLSSFLLASKTTPTQRFAYDGIRLTATPMDNLTIDAWAMKLAELSPLEQDGDTDFYGVYGTYTGLEPVSLSAYWLWIRDASGISDTNGTWLNEQLEDWVGLDQYEGMDMHTVGVAASGKSGSFDYSLNAAYQFGDAGQLGRMFTRPILGVLYGDDDAEYDCFGGDVSLGYTIDCAWKVRPYVSACYYDGEDNRDISFLEWLNPFSQAEASVSFNRLFSDVNYAPVINDNADMTNFWQVNAGVTMTPTEKTWVMLRANNTWAVETFDWPVYFEVGNRRIPFAPIFPFWTKESDDNLGLSAEIIAKYNYTEDLSLLLYYGHLWPGDGLRDGAYVNSYGTVMNGGLNDKDADYVFFWTLLKF